MLALGMPLCINSAYAQDAKINYPYKFKCERNPIVGHIRAADPHCNVFPDGKLWIYTSQDHDPDSGQGYYSKMGGYHVFSTNDMVNWTDHGEILHSRDVKWGIEGGGWMWAVGAAYKNGKYYLYFSHKDKEGKWRIGASVSGKPEGPFVPEPVYMKGTVGIDPKCFIDDDGQAYLYFGHGLVAKLKDNMLELAEEPRKLNLGEPCLSWEGSYMHKFNGTYYLSWTDWECQDYQGYYAMGDNPYGPFVFKGPVNPFVPEAQDHHSIIEYKGKWYYFYHTASYTNEKGEVGGGNRRNASVEFLNYNEDGTMQLIKQTKEGIWGKKE